MGPARRAADDRHAVTISWPNRTDHDVHALVWYLDGHVETVSQFGTKDDRVFSPRTADGAVVHLGDQRRGARGATTTTVDEVIAITLAPEIDRIVLELYSAPKSERRPVVNADGSVTMDAGPVNAYE